MPTNREALELQRRIIENQELLIEKLQEVEALEASITELRTKLGAVLDKTAKEHLTKLYSTGRL
jgi:hypothetical protein